MTLNARKVKNTSSGKKAPLIDAGAYPGRLQGIVDLGLQKQEYKGEVKAPKRDIWYTYELSDEFMLDEDGSPDESKPRWFSERLPLNNLDSDLAKSTKRYYALDPNEEAEGDWPKLITKPVIVTMTNDGSYNNIGGTSAMRPKEASKLPDLVNPPRIFLFDEPDVEVFRSLPQFVQDWIKEGLEYEGSKLQKLLNGEKVETKKKPVTVDEDEIPPFDNSDSPSDEGADW